MDKLHKDIKSRWNILESQGQHILANYEHPLQMMFKEKSFHAICLVFPLVIVSQ